MAETKDEQAKSVRLLAMVDEACRRAGGKHLLTREEYLDIVRYCYREVYGETMPHNPERASTA